MKKILIFSSLVITCIAFIQCNENNDTVKKNNTPVQKRITINYHIDSAKQWLKKTSPDSQQFQIILAVNRTDKENFSAMDSVIIPDNIGAGIEHYFPFPFAVPAIEKIIKIIFFSYPAQAFGAYENGKLVYTGPTNMGRKKDLTPTGLFYTNWKAEETQSTFDDEWVLKWNFNIENQLGVGWHQYALPGYPASHSCLRLNEKDARYLYGWADQWVLDEKNKDSLIFKGTPVVVFGSYNFDGPKPWFQLVPDPNALNISDKDIEQIAAPHLNDIIAQQEKRKSINSN